MQTGIYVGCASHSLGPHVLDKILEGLAHPSVMLELLERRLPASWAEQRDFLVAR
jgi:hypothetical protein